MCVLQTYAQAAKDRAAYTAALGRGQFPDSALLATERRLDLILDCVLALTTLIAWRPLVGVRLNLADEGWLVTAVDRLLAGERLYADST